MTRETKLGLIVSASFVSLIGVVVAAKLQEANALPMPDEVALTASAPELPKAPTSSGVEPVKEPVNLQKPPSKEKEDAVTPATLKVPGEEGTGSGSGTEQQLGGNENWPVPQEPIEPTATPAPTQVAVVPPKPAPEPVKPEPESPEPDVLVTPTTTLSEPAEKVQPGTLVSNGGSSPKPMTTEKEQQGEWPASGQQSEANPTEQPRTVPQPPTALSPPAPVAPPVPFVPGGAPVPSPAGQVEPPPDAPPEPIQDNPGKDLLGGPPAVTPPGLTPPVMPSATPPGPGRVEGPPPPVPAPPAPTPVEEPEPEPPAEEKSVPQPAPVPVTTPFTENKQPPGGQIEKDKANVTPPAPASPPDVVVHPVVTAPTGAGGSPPGVTPMPPIPPAAPPSADDAPEPVPVVKPETNPMPPLGTPPAVQTPAIQIGTPTVQPRQPASVPQVDSFDEQMYRCQGGDTFDTVARRFCGSPEYAQALLLFNRAHPMAGEGLQQVPPVLNAGTIVYIPPNKILEKRYPTVIPNLTVRNDKPTQVAQPSQPTPSPAAPVQSVWKKYRVRGPGERMMDIATRALGNWERWKEIYKLNNQYQPHAMVPANAVLNLPPDAKIDADHTP